VTEPDIVNEPGIGAADIHRLDEVRNAVVVLLAGLPRSPERLRLKVHDIEVELDWPATAPASSDAPPAIVVVDPLPTGLRITAATVGTFYSRPEPGAEPFVQVGDRVKPGQQVAILEAMKLMMPVEADVDGVITEVLVDEGQSVEHGQALFAVDPEA
jgi:acetyl-CoA carboxylase biotin carboxyl carrier protein